MPKSSRWMPTPSPRRDSRACRAESVMLKAAVSVTSITSRAGSTRWAVRVSVTVPSQSGEPSWTAETLTLIWPGRSTREASIAQRPGDRVGRVTGLERDQGDRRHPGLGRTPL